MKLKLIKKHSETSDVTTFIFEPNQPFSWQAGQYLKYYLPHDNPDERGTDHFFTIASSETEGGQVQLTTRFNSQKGSSFKKTLQSLELGAEVEAEGPFGSFTITDPDQDYVFIAGGIGITPFRAIFVDLSSRNRPINVNLLYANRDQNIVFKDELEQIQKTQPSLKIDYIIDPEKIDQKKLRESVPDLQKPIFYLSGPKPMVEALSQTLNDMGVLEDQIKHDSFSGYDQI